MSERRAADLAESIASFFHSCPIGLVSFADDGAIKLANPEAVNLLMPALGTPVLLNVFDLLEPTWPDLPSVVVGSAPGVRVVQNYRVAFSAGPHRVHLAFTVVRIDADDNMIVMADVTQQVADEEQRMDLLDRERQARERTELLERSATSLAAATTVEDIAHVILADLKKALDIDIATVNVIDGAGIRILASAETEAAADALGPGVLHRYQHGDADDGALPGPLAMRSNSIIQVDTAAEILDRFPLVAESVKNHVLESLLATPLRSADGDALGALVVGSPEPHWLDATTMSLLGGIADQAGLALERALLFEQVLEAREQEHAIAVRLQTALLPADVVSDPKLRIAASYRAAADLLSVGGDWYETFAWPDGSVGLMVGDVAGHDLDALAAMGVLRASVAALAPVIGPQPAELLDALEDVASGPGRASYVTAACVVLQPSTGELIYATAGHPPPLLVGADGSTTWLDQANSPPVGHRLVDKRLEATHHMDGGSTLVLYSDGLVERRGETLTVGLERLAMTAGGLHRADPETLPDELMAAMIDGETMADDIVVVTTRLES